MHGLEPTHYRASLSVDHLADGLSGSEQKAAQQMLSNLRAALPNGELPVDVWIDAHQLVRRVAVNIALNLPTGPSMNENVVADLTGYGPQRQPVIPPSDQVMDLSNLVPAAG